ncbi:MAG: hypothetical protein ACMXYB_04365 [Candidatus Woesearchaeota archaeon]
MKYSTLEIELQDFKDTKIQELDALLEQESLEINSLFEKEKKELETYFNKKFEVYSKIYSSKKLNQAKKETKLIRLKAITDAKNELENRLLHHYKDSFVDIVVNLLPFVEKILNTKSKYIILISPKDFSKDFKKTMLFKEIVEDNCLNKTEIIFSYNDELVRFNLKDEIKKILEKEIGGLR